MNDRNLWIAVALSAAILLIYQALVANPQAERRRAALEAQQQAAEATTAAPADVVGAPTIAMDSATPTASTPGAPGVASGRENALALAPGHIAINASEVRGRINLFGARIDDLFLKNYTHELKPADPAADQIELLAPQGADDAYYILHGWTPGANGLTDLPGPETVWTAVNDATLSDGRSVQLVYESEDGLLFERTISIDEHYMFQITDRVTNRSDNAASLAPYALINRYGIPDDLQNFFILHEGLVGVFDGKLTERKYKKLANNGPIEASSRGGWLGITDKYWLTALIPPQDQQINATYRTVRPGGAAEPIFQANYVMTARTVAPGETIEIIQHAFAGAKKVDILRGYQKADSLGVADFDRAIDWGHLFFLTKPIFVVLNYFGGLTGNFGVAILLLTLGLKLILFPLANKSYESMSKMKKLQPEVTKLREAYADDKMKMQQEMMALYKKEKLNPLAGCLPVLVQIPVFYALYKTLFVTIELRQAPFFGWIQDLSAPDPTSIFNLFGLLPYDPGMVPVIGSFLMIGVWPLAMGIAMWFQTKLNPPPADPVQQQVFALMPIFFTFLLAGFASGLVIYWFWNTALSILQQWVIMKRMGVSVDWGVRFKTPAFARQLLDKAKADKPDAAPKGDPKKP